MPQLPLPALQDHGRVTAAGPGSALPRMAVTSPVVQERCCWVCKSRRGGRVAGELTASVAIAACL